MAPEIKTIHFKNGSSMQYSPSDVSLKSNIQINGVTVEIWAVQHADGWGWVSDFYCDPFAEPKTGGAMLATIPNGTYSTPKLAIEAGKSALNDLAS